MTNLNAEEEFVLDEQNFCSKLMQNEVFYSREEKVNNFAWWKKSNTQNIWIKTMNESRKYFDINLNIVEHLSTA